MIKKGEDIAKHYKIEGVLGEGSFGIVKRGTNRKTGEEVAIKIFNKATLGEDDEVLLRNEVDILSAIDHPNVVKLYEVYEDEDFVYLVLEIMVGGEMFDRIVEKEHYSEKEASDTVRPLIDAIKYCHSLGVVHRDLKPENLLYASKAPHSPVKISDFGLAKLVNKELMTTACGTPGYVAPEVLMGGGYGHQVDYWSLGVIIYILLCGFPPFAAETNAELFEQIKKGEFDFPSPYWDPISDMAKELIKGILVVDPAKRLSAEKILAHPWIVGVKTPRKELPSVTSKIKEYNAKSKFRKLATVALVTKKIETLILARKPTIKK